MYEKDIKENQNRSIETNIFVKDANYFLQDCATFPGVDHKIREKWIISAKIETAKSAIHERILFTHPLGVEYNPIR